MCTVSDGQYSVCRCFMKPIVKVIEKRYCLCVVSNLYFYCYNFVISPHYKVAYPVCSNKDITVTMRHLKITVDVLSMEDIFASVVQLQWKLQQQQQEQQKQQLQHQQLLELLLHCSIFLIWGILYIIYTILFTLNRYVSSSCLLSQYFG